MKSALNGLLGTARGQLKIILSLGVLALPTLFFLLQGLQGAEEASPSAFQDAQKLYQGIGTASQLQDQVAKLNGTLEAAGNVFKAKGLNQKYNAQISKLRTGLDTLKREFMGFESTQTYFDQAQGAIDSIDKLAVKIFADDWSVSQMTRYVRSVKKNQAKVKDALSEAAAEMDSLLAEQFESTEEPPGTTSSKGLTETLIFTVIFGFISLLFYFRLRNQLSGA